MTKENSDHPAPDAAQIEAFRAGMDDLEQRLTEISGELTDIMAIYRGFLSMQRHIEEVWTHRPIPEPDRKTLNRLASMIEERLESLRDRLSMSFIAMAAAEKAIGAK